MLRADIITAIKAQLDELSVLSSDTPDTDLIESVLNDVTVKFLKVAPVRLLDVDTFNPTSGTPIGDGSYYISLPAGFLRLVELFDSVEWGQPITELSVGRIFSDKYNRPGKAKPAAMIWISPTGATVLRFMPNATFAGGNAYYISYTLPEAISDDNAIPGLAYMAAQEVFSILGDIEGVKLAGEKFTNWLQINQT